MTNVVIRPSPFRLEVAQHIAVAGQSIADILRDVPGLPPEIWSHGVVRIGEWEIPRDRWHLVKPRPGGRHIVHVGVRFGDGGGGSGKNPFVTIAAIALVVAATAISGGALGPGGIASISSTLFAAGSTSAALAAAGVSVIGALALNALAPPPTAAAAKEDQGGAQLGSASIRGNVLQPFEPIPFVIGTHRVSPPHLVMPWSEAVNDDQYVYAIVGLNGAHDLDDIRLNGAPIDDFDGVEYEVRDVVNDDSDLTLIDKQVYENQTGAEIGGHKLSDENTDELQDVSTPANSYPQWQSARSRSAPDEIWLTFVWSGLIFQTSGDTVPAGMPIRIRIRRAGDSDWINLPEFIAARERLEPFRGMIKIRFEQDPGSLTRVDEDNSFPPWRYALYVVNADNGESFDVASYFTALVDNHAVHVGSENGVAVVYLNPNTFPPGVYDVQIKRGYGFRDSNFSASAYQLSSQTPYFFSHTPASSPPAIRQEQSKAPGKVSLQSMSSVWNEYPLGAKGMALLAVKAKNIAVSSLTVLASGYAFNYDGADWDTFEPTSNPAAWARTLALGQQTIRAPYIAAQLDDDNFADWHDYCEDAALACNAFISGDQSVGDVLRIVAAAGKASWRASDKVGVVIDRDRSAELPIQLFSQRNTRGLSIRRAFPRIPHGFRVRYNDASNDYQPAEFFVYRPGYNGDNATDIEAVTYVGITTTSQALARARLDFAQLLRRSTLYSLEADIENLYCVRGSLVSLAHDTVARHHDAARVVSVATSGANVTGLTLDAALRLSLIGMVVTPDGEELLAPDGEPVIWGGYPAGVVIQLKNGTTLVKEIVEETDTDTITFATPFAIPADSDLEADCLVACGPFDSVEKRMLVLGIRPQSELTASLTLIDEAPPVGIIAPGGDRIFAPDGSRIRAPF